MVDKFADEDEWKAWEFDFKVLVRATDAKLAEPMEVAGLDTQIIAASDTWSPKWDDLEDMYRQRCSISPS